MTVAEFRPIEDEERKGQIISFENLRLGRHWPSDIDGCYEIASDVFLFFEYKLSPSGNFHMDVGQELMYTHLVDRLRAGGAKAIAIGCTHDVGDKDEHVDGGNCIVASYYDGETKVNGRLVWVADGKRTAKQLADEFIEKSTK